MGHSAHRYAFSIGVVVVVVASAKHDSEQDNQVKSPVDCVYLGFMSRIGSQTPTCIRLIHTYLCLSPLFLHGDRDHQLIKEMMFTAR